MSGVGTEWLVDAYDCKPGPLQDAALLKKLTQTILDDLHLRAAQPPIAHVFPDPGGVTLMVLLMESHLTVHTYPERGLATFNLYCCNERPAWPWESALRAALGAGQVSVRSVARGRPAA